MSSGSIATSDSQMPFVRRDGAQKAVRTRPSGVRHLQVVVVGQGYVGLRGLSDHTLWG